MSADDGRRDALAAWLRAEIGTNPGTPLGQGYQATVHRYASPLGDIVVKRPHESFPLRLLGLAALRREQQIYERIEGVAGIPKSFGLLDDRYLVLESITGPSLRDHERHLQNRERFFADLYETIAAMHAAGVAHGDLKRKDNVLVGPGERPYIIDFGVASLRKHPARNWNSMRFAWFVQLDVNAWVKLKYRRNMSELSPEDAARYRPLWLERIARWIRIPWQKLTLRRPRQRWRQAARKRRDERNR